MPHSSQDHRDRRLATIMAADIVGYSRLMDADEESTYNALRNIRTEYIDRVIGKYGGRIVKHLGDGFLAEFSTVMSAVQFAMNLQEKVATYGTDLPKSKQIRFRVGINLGDIIVDDEGDIFGDGVNVAARLESMAIPGGICVSGPVHASVHKKLEVKFEDLGDQTVKNIATPVRAYDLRWPGEGGEERERPIKPAARPKRTGLIASGLAAVITVLGILLWQNAPFSFKNDAPPDNSIAVLPFLNLSSDTEQEYFSDGLSEELLNLLARIPELRVISRSSAFSYKGKDVQLKRIAEELNVTHILEGSVRKAGNDVRITAQLIEAGSDTHLWSETYDRTLDDIFAIQDEIAATVVERLTVTLLNEMPKVRETDPDAYALFLRANHLSDQVTTEALAQSNELLERVLKIDPGYTPARNSLAANYMNQVVVGAWSLEDGYALARDEIQKVLALEPNNAGAHALKAIDLMVTEDDLATAAKQLEFAISLAPESTSLIGSGALMLMQLDRMDEAVELLEYVTTVDPVNPIGFFQLGDGYYYANRWDAAIEAYRSVLQLSPGFSGAHSSIYAALILQGNAQAASVEFNKETGLSEEDKKRLLLIDEAFLHREMGQKQKFESSLKEIIERYGEQEPSTIAELYAWAGETDSAFTWLEKEFETNPIQWFEWQSPFFKPLHADPRWSEILDRAGKSPEKLNAIEFEVALPENR